MWNVEKDPYLELDLRQRHRAGPSPDIDRLRRRMLRWPCTHPPPAPARRPGPRPLRRRPSGTTTPTSTSTSTCATWRCRRPATERQLFDLASQIVQDPFDRTRPLWEFVLVDGLEGGRAALVQKMHHTITDGEGGIRMSEQFIDVVRDAPDVDEVDHHRRAATEHAIARRDRRRRRSPTRGVARSASPSARSAWRRRPCRHPSAASARSGPTCVETAALGGPPGDRHRPAHSPLWTEPHPAPPPRGARRPFDDARRRPRRSAAASTTSSSRRRPAAAGAYHRELGAPVDDAAHGHADQHPHRQRSAGGNSFVPTRVLVPTGELDPADAVRRRCTRR